MGSVLLSPGGYCQSRMAVHTVGTEIAHLEVDSHVNPIFPVEQSGAQTDLLRVEPGLEPSSLLPSLYCYYFPTLPPNKCFCFWKIR